MKNKSKENYKEWMKKAEEDELSANLIVRENGISATACFLFQQMAEKLLKGLLVFHGKNFPKVHDLLELETLLLKIESDVKNYEKELDLLNTYYIETRYPGDYPEFTPRDAKEASEAAQKIKE